MKNKTKEIAYDGKCNYCNHIHTDITIMNCTLCFSSLKHNIFDYIIRNDLNQYHLDFDINIDGFFDYKMNIKECLRKFDKLNKQNNKSKYINTSIYNEIIFMFVITLVLLFIGITINFLPMS